MEILWPPTHYLKLENIIDAKFQVLNFATEVDKTVGAFRLRFQDGLTVVELVFQCEGARTLFQVAIITSHLPVVKTCRNSDVWSKHLFALTCKPSCLDGVWEICEMCVPSKSIAIVRNETPTKRVEGSIVKEM